MKTWMVVEDEIDLYEMVLAMYDTLNIQSVSFLTGEEAIEWIDEVDSGQYNNDLPQLALLDIRLPGQVTGDAVGARLRRSPYLKNMVIVLMTAYHLSYREEKEVLRLSGADKLLYKPLPSMREFQKIMEELILNHRVNN